MLTVTYKYTCDCCRQPVREPQEYHCSALMKPPLPVLGDNIGNFALCQSCFQEAMTEVRKLAAKHQ